MPTNTPYFSPAFMKQQQRLFERYSNRGSRQPNMNDPQQAARGLYGMGVKIGQDGSAQPTQDFGGMMAKESQQVNSLTPGIKGGAFSSLGKPMNSMYEQNPGFFNRGGNAVQQFGDAIAQRGTMGMSRDQNIEQAKRNGTFESIRDTFNQRAKSFGQMMDEAGNIQMAPMTAGAQTQNPSQNLARLQEAVAAKKLMEEAAGAPRVTIPTVTRPMPGNNNVQTIPMMGAKNIEGKYGTGFSTVTTDKNAPRPEGLINGRPFSEVMQGLANKPGIARPGDKFQPQQLTPAENEKLKKAAQNVRR